MAASSPFRTSPLNAEAGEIEGYSMATSFQQFEDGKEASSEELLFNVLSLS